MARSTTFSDGDTEAGLEATAFAAGTSGKRIESVPRVREHGRLRRSRLLHG
jgi:hypothetical protein